jgi:hypothetical protein
MEFLPFSIKQFARSCISLRHLQDNFLQFSRWTAIVPISEDANAAGTFAVTTLRLDKKGKKTDNKIIIKIPVQGQILRLPDRDRKKRKRRISI